MAHTTISKPDRETVLRLAGSAVVDPRTAERFLSGGTVRGLMLERLQRGCKAIGIPIPDEKKGGGR